MKDSQEFAEKEIERLRGKMTDTITTIKEHSEDIEFFLKYQVRSLHAAREHKNLQRQRRISGKYRRTDKKAVCYEIANSE